MRNIPENNLAYPVLIKLNTGDSSSGFQLKSGTTAYIVTAKHVLFDEKAKLKADTAEAICQTCEIDDDTTTIFKIDFKHLETTKNIFYHSTADVAAFKTGIIKENEIAPIPGVSIVQNGKSDVVLVDAQKAVLPIKNILISNEVFAFGYPSSIGLQELPQFDYEKPLLRKGIIANVNKKQGTIILDCPIYYGNSGGPVVQVSLEGQNRHMVIGVVSQFIPYEESWKNESNGIIHVEFYNSGYSVAVAMDYVFEMLGIKL